MGCVKSDRFIVKLMDQFLPCYHHIKWKLKKKKKNSHFCSNVDNLTNSKPFT